VCQGEVDAFGPGLGYKCLAYVVFVDLAGAVAGRDFALKAAIAVSSATAVVRPAAFGPGSGTPFARGP
jgi:hypothetical protein